MSYRDYSKTKYQTTRRIVKDSAQGKISGVCAGVANYYQIPTVFIRIIAVLAGITLPTLTVLAYIVAAIVLPNR